MPAKVFVFDQIKKLIGWCPNAKAHEARKQADLENFGYDIPDRAKGDNRDLKNSGWLWRVSTQVLLFAIFCIYSG